MMAKLNDLPPELLLEILSHVCLNTFQLWKFLGISKIIYDKIAFLIYRKELRRLYAEINWPKFPDAGSLKTFRLLLRTVIRRPDLAEMVKSLVLASGWRHSRGVYEIPRTGSFSGDEKAFLEAGQRIGFSQDSVNYRGPAKSIASSRAWQSFRWGIQSGHIGAELILLLAHLSNLESLHLDIQAQPSILMWGRLLTSNTHSLSNLKSLKLYGHPFESITLMSGAQDISFLLTLPSLKALHICDWDWSKGTLLPASLESIRIKDLTMENCTVNDSLFNSLGRTRGLERFTILALNNPMHHLNFPMAAMVHFLHSQQATLQCLHVDLYSLRHYSQHIRSLKELTHLTELHLNSVTLLGSLMKLGYGQSLEEFLPRSLQEFHIKRPASPGSRMENLLERFAEFLSSNRSQFPDLDMIHIDFAGRWSSYEFGKLGIKVFVM